MSLILNDSINSHIMQLAQPIASTAVASQIGTRTHAHMWGHIGTHTHARIDKGATYTHIRAARSLGGDN